MRLWEYTFFNKTDVAGGTYQMDRWGEWQWDGHSTNSVPACLVPWYNGV